VTARIAAPAAWALVDLWLDLRHDPFSSYGEKLAEIEDCEASR
jgi:ribose 5-phosphate isomerase